MKRTIFLIVALLSMTLGFSQRSNIEKIKVTGKVIDQETKQPLEYATVILQNTQRTQLLTGGITDEKGDFEVEIPAGNYDIRVEYISFKSYELKGQNIRTNKSLGTISLSLDVASLDEVEVVAERTQVEIRLDKRIYNVGKDLIAQGGTVTDVLDNVPSVSVDVEGTISLRGNDNVRILINGKPSALVGLSGTDALRQLPADAIEKVEVITSPSARYDAEGTAGILNIILKRSKIQGLNGSITLSSGYPLVAGASANINYRTEKLNLFTNSGYTYREVPGNSFTDNTFFDASEQITGSSQETRDFNRVRKGLNTNIGIEYFINESSSLTGTVLYRKSDNERNTINDIFNFDPNGNLLSQTQRFDPEVEDDKTLQFSLNYEKKFKEDGHTLSFDFQHEDSTEDEKSIIVDTEIVGDGSVEREFVRTLEDQQRILLQADYVLPIGKESQFEAGYRGTFADQTNDYTVAFEENGFFVNDTDLSNILNYREYVNAFYAQFGSKTGKLSYLLGLRMEESNININQITTADFNNKRYTDLFPTVNLAYEFSETESLTLGYNRRIRRPRSRFINPFPSRSSATNLFQGNPDIDPSYSNGLDLGYLKRWEKFTFNSSIYFQRATQSFTFITEETGETVVVSGESGTPSEVRVPVLRRTPVNLSKNDRYGFEFTLAYNPSRKWRMNGNFNFFESITRGDFNGQNFDAENISWFLRFNNTYTLPGKITWQTRLFYRGPSETAQSKNQGIFSADTGFSKDFFKEKATLNLNVSDVFNIRKRKSESFTPNTFSYSEFQWRERSIIATFTYRFNQKKNQRDRQRNGGDDDLDFEG
ncbi:outer membrane beta-barrel protein [Sungkyunkwania multivorans]|uniref:Outer membrane beta-barrel protein n=1 Tax=Sungkyunkwania multivorans TaxID=1173618 RepID=A0ABW3CX32_9FLAO